MYYSVNKKKHTKIACTTQGTITATHITSNTTTALK